MTIAVPVWQQRISPVLDTAARLLIVSRRHGKEIARREHILSPAPPLILAQTLEELKVDVVLCAALSESLHCELRRRGLNVRRHLCGEVDVILQAFCNGCVDRPEFRMPGCWGVHARGECCRQRKLPRTGKQPAKISIRKTNENSDSC